MLLGIMIGLSTLAVIAHGAHAIYLALYPSTGLFEPTDSSMGDSSSGAEIDAYAQRQMLLQGRVMEK